MSCAIIEDKGQQAKKHEIKHRWFSENNINLLNMPLPVGDYILLTDTVEDVIKRKEKRGIPVKKMDFLGSYNKTVDTKKDILEVAANICGPQHARFRDECILAQNNGIQLYVLVENQDDIGNIEDLYSWENPRLKRYEKIRFMHQIGKWKNIPEPKLPPVAGETLAKAMLTMENKYDVKFLFCTPEEAGERILSLLTE